MPNLKRGPWLLRFKIIVDRHRETSSLSCLTGHGIDRVVTIEPRELDNLKQIWYAVPVEGKKDHYNVVQDPDLTHPPGLALVKGSNKVIVSLQPDEWRLEYQPVEIANGNVYKLHPPSSEIIGVYRLLGKEPDGSEAVIQEFAVIPGNPDPAWQFLGTEI